MPPAEITDTADYTPHALLPFLHQQSQNTLTRLYQRPSSCLSIFRLLAPFERQLVMSLLWLEKPITTGTILAWVVPGSDGKKQYEQALDTLSRLYVVPGGASGQLSLNPTFRTSMRQAMTGGGTSGSFGLPATEDPSHAPSGVKALDEYALERWETILHFMVSSGTGQNPKKPSNGVLFLLERSGLMLNFEGVLRITSAGFQFLLQAPHTQLWELLLQYLRLAQARDMDPVEVLSFFFMLSTTELGRDYATSNLSRTQIAMLEDLRDYGLLWQSKPNSRRFSPTRLATSLTSSSPPLPSTTGPAGDAGFIVLETNYRVYAYTDNPLQTAVLNLFVTLKSRFPNLVVGQVTRESVKRALANGITAEQIISYMTTHAHPQMRKNNPLIPVTVQDQIRLWELEKNRLTSDDGYLYTDFQSQSDYEYVLEYAQQLNVVLWENALRRCFFVEAGGHANLKEFISRRAG